MIRAEPFRFADRTLELVFLSNMRGRLCTEHDTSRHGLGIIPFSMMPNDPLLSTLSRGRRPALASPKGLVTIPVALEP